MAVGIGASIIGLFSASTATAITLGTASALTTALAGVIGGAVIGAAVGGLSAAITGGDLGKGLLFGAVGGAVAGGLSGYLGATAGGIAQGAGAVAPGAGQTAVQTGMSVADTAAIQAGTGTAYATTSAVTPAVASEGTSVLGTIGQEAPGRFISEGGMKIAGSALEGYFEDEAMQDQIAAQKEEARLQREWQAQQNALNRGHEENMLKLGGRGGNSGLLQYKLGMAQLDENIRQFDVQRRDYLKSREAAKEALSGFRIKKAETGKGPVTSAMDSVESPEPQLA